MAEAVADSPVRIYLVVALDDWARNEPDARARDRLLEITRRADPGPWGNRLRDPAVWNNTAALQRTAKEAPVADLPPHQLVLLLQNLRETWPGSRESLAVATARHPGHFWLQFEVGYHYFHKDADPARAVAHLRAALAVRPDCRYALTLLAHACMSLRDLDGAIACSQEAIRLDPKDSAARTNLGMVLGDVDQAIAEFKEAIRLDPKNPAAHMHLGFRLRNKNELDGAITEYKEAIRLDPKVAQTHTLLALALRDKGDVGGAIEHFREAIRLEPKNAAAHEYLGMVLGANEVDQAIAEFKEAIRLNPKSPSAHLHLGFRLRNKNDLDGTIAEYKETIRLYPKSAEAHTFLALALRDKGDVDGAIEHFREAIRLEPKNAATHGYLRLLLSSKGNDLRGKGDVDGAIAAYKEAIRLDPKDASAHINLGALLCDDKRDLDGAIGCFREAIRLDSKSAHAHCNLGIALCAKGDLDAAIAAHKEAMRLNPKFAAALTSLRRAERYRELLTRLPDIAAGRAEPKTPAEAVELAELCGQPFQRRYVLAARLYEKAFTADPKLADSMAADHRYNAACYAALGGCGKGTDAGPRSPADRAALRPRALAWLRADLTIRKKQAASSNPADRKTAAEKMTHWLGDLDLSGVRPGPAQVGMPVEERAQWDALWAEVRATRNRALGPPPQPVKSP